MLALLLSQGLCPKGSIWEAVSTPWVLYCGVPPGSIISPMLFNTRLPAKVIQTVSSPICRYCIVQLSFTISAVKAVQTLEWCLALIERRLTG